MPSRRPESMRGCNAKASKRLAESLNAHNWSAAAKPSSAACSPKIRSSGSSLLSVVRAWAFRPIFEGNNTVGRAISNRVPLDFGDDAISAEAQAYIRYDSNDRSFLFVPNLAKTNVVSVNDKKPTGAVDLKPWT